MLKIILIARAFDAQSDIYKTYRIVYPANMDEKQALESIFNTLDYI